MNEEIKEQFYAASKQNEGRRRYLEHLAESEDFFGLDICQLSRPQAIEAVQRMETYDLGTFDTFISGSKAYAKWCYNNGFFQNAPYGILGISAMDVNPQDFVRRYIFLTEKDLIDVIRPIIPIYDGYIEVISCIFAWLGIEDPLSIRDSDVFIEGRKILKNGMVVVDGFSDFIADFLTQYQKLKVSTRENGTTIYTVVKDCSYDTFIKQFCSVNSSKRGKKIDIRVVQTAINKLNKKYEENGNPPRITYRNIMKSGSLARLYSAEQKGLDVFDRKNKEIVESFFCKTDYRSIVWLYKHYKEAFNL